MNWFILTFPFLFSMCCSSVLADAISPIANLSCGCTLETLPHPRIVLLGPTGVGKSTFGNRLFGINDYNGKEAICSQNNEQRPFKFGVGHSTVSYTVETSWMVGHFLGDPKNPCLTIIDTPGTGDTEGRDCEHGIALAKGIKEIGSIDAFIVMFKGTNPRFSEPMQQQIRLYMNIFGEEMFENAITEFSFWSHDSISIFKRNVTRGLNEEKQHKAWNEEYASRMTVPREIPSIFIDPVYFEGFAQEGEKKKNKKYEDKLWTLLTKNFTKFNCDKRCKAPSGFFNGQPWLFEENELINKRREERLTITWQIWFGGCDGNGTTNYRIYFQNKTDLSPRMIYNHKEETEKEKEIKTYNINLKNPRGVRITDRKLDKFKTIKLYVDYVVEDHFGEYYLGNDLGNSTISSVNEIIDGQWGQWGAFGDCSKSCLEANGIPGDMVRERACIPPQNGGLPCQGDTFSTKKCAHRPGDSPDSFRPCPVDAQWSEWLKWGSCSSNCRRKGENTPTQTRQRTCFEERNGGNSCAKLDREAKENNLPMTEDKRYCAVGECPSPASLGPWSEWSQCPVTCVGDGQPTPQISRKRQCKKETLSTDKILNQDILTCGEIDNEHEYQFCSIPICPVEPVWMEWQHWSDCTQSCSKNGTAGTRARNRGFIPGRYGDMEGKSPKLGSKHQEEECNEDVECPEMATWQWGEWSACDRSCYYPDGGMGVRYRTNNCTEGDPKHEYLNCDYPKGGLTDIQLECPDLPQCEIPVRIVKEKGCYALDTIVTTSYGTKKLMKDLKVGEEVVSDEEGRLTKFVGWMELDYEKETMFLEIITDDGEKLTLTGTHNVFFYQDGKPTSIFAKYLSPGNVLVGGSGKGKVIRSMRNVKMRGYLDPLTQSGTIVSNNITTSCYASYPHTLANIALLPARMFPELLLENEETQDKEGTRTYIRILKWIGRAFNVSFKEEHKKEAHMVQATFITTVMMTFVIHSYVKPYIM